MSVRTTMSVVRFSSEFMLGNFDTPQPAGDYRVEHDEEPIEGISTLAYRRVATYMHLPAIEAASRTQQLVPIDPGELEAALEKDRNPT